MDVFDSLEALRNHELQQKTPPLRTKKNKLTSYAFACGEVETYGGEYNSLTLSGTIIGEGNKYIIKGYIEDKHIYERQKTLKEARKRIKELLKPYNE